MPSYLLRNIEPALWAKVKARAVRDGVSLRVLVLALLAGYADKSVSVSGVSVSKSTR